MKRNAQKKTRPGKKPAKPAATPVAVKSPSKPQPAANAKAAGPQADLLGEIREVRTLLSRLVEPPRSGQAALESGVDSLRRLLSEMMESRTESVVSSLAAIRGLAVKGDARAVEAIDRLLAELGAVRFVAARLDYVDPLIHRVAGERADTGAPDGVILDTLQPGFRTGRGAVVAKAAVIVNRRS
jgi:hypothetical protein